MLASLIEQSQILIDTYDDFRTLSNWGIMQNCGLASLALNYQRQVPVLSEHLAIALERLAYQCQIQILPDGIHWEQSPMYHNEVLNCLLDVAFDYEYLGQEVPEFLLLSIKKLAYAMAYMKKPNHCQPMQGDSDETDVRDIISKAAYILKDGSLKYFGYQQLDSDSVWETGAENIEKYQAIVSQPPEFSSVALKASGNYYLRDSFAENSHYLRFRCGAIGSGHGHAEQLHFDLVCHGEDFIGDAGRFTYLENNQDRLFLKSCFAHNTTIVDGQPFTEFEGAWRIKKSALALNSYHCFKPNYDYVEAGHLGYLGLASPVVVGRKILYLKPDIWVIMDEFISQASHSYQQIFNFYPDKHVEINQQSVKVKGKNNKLYMYWPQADVKLTLNESIFSREYNKKEANQQLVSCLSAEQSQTLFTVISTQELKVTSMNLLRGDGSEVPIDEAQALEIRLSSGDKIQLFNAMIDIHHKKKSYLLDDLLFYGKTGFILNQNGNKQLEVIRY